MSKADIVNKFKKPKLTAADKLYGNEENDVINETAVNNEEIVINETAATNEDEKNIEDAIANAYPDEDDKPEKVLKGIYLDADVLAVYNAVAKLKGRGWGSQKVSDLLREDFVKQGLMKK